MKTIICSSYIQPALYHQLANGSGGVSDVRLIPLGALFPHVEEGDANALLLKARRLLLDHQSQFPIYRAIFSYPAFQPVIGTVVVESTEILTTVLV